MAGLVREELSKPVEIARPVARDPRLAQSFTRLFARLTAPELDALRTEAHMIRALMGLCGVMVSRG